MVIYIRQPLLACAEYNSQLRFPSRGLRWKSGSLRLRKNGGLPKHAEYPASAPVKVVSPYQHFLHTQVFPGRGQQDRRVSLATKIAFQPAWLTSPGTLPMPRPLPSSHLQHRSREQDCKPFLPPDSRYPDTSVMKAFAIVR